jgi:hypothetical protein
MTPTWTVPIAVAKPAWTPWPSETYATGSAWFVPIAPVAPDMSFDPPLVHAANPQSFSQRQNDALTLLQGSHPDDNPLSPLHPSVAAGPAQPYPTWLVAQTSVCTLVMLMNITSPRVTRKNPTVHSAVIILDNLTE